MQKIKLFFFIFVVFSLVRSCSAMNRGLEEASSSLVPVCKACLSDGLKLTVGAGITSVCLLGMFAQIAGCGAPKESMSNFGQFLCSDYGLLTLSPSAGVSGLYTIYQAGKFSLHSWYLSRIIKNKLFDTFSEAFQFKNTLQHRD